MKQVAAKAMTKKKLGLSNGAELYRQAFLRSQG
jgi:hypothetical protein